MQTNHPTNHQQHWANKQNEEEKTRSVHTYIHILSVSFFLAYWCGKFLIGFVRFFLLLLGIILIANEMDWFTRKSTVPIFFPWLSNSKKYSSIMSEDTQTHTCTRTSHTYRKRWSHLQMSIYANDENQTKLELKRTRKPNPKPRTKSQKTMSHWRQEIHLKFIVLWDIVLIPGASSAFCWMWICMRRYTYTWMRVINNGFHLKMFLQCSAGMANWIVCHHF